MPKILKITLAIMALFIFGMYCFVYYEVKAHHARQIAHRQELLDNFAKKERENPEATRRENEDFARRVAQIKYNSDISNIKSMCEVRMRDSQQGADFLEARVPLGKIFAKQVRVTQKDCQRWINNYQRTGRMPT
jgi:hypothetical protein